MLKEEVVAAVSNNKFHIYSVSKVEEAIEILTGTRAGKKLKNGKFETNTVFGEVEKELAAMRKRLRPSEKKKKNSNGKEENHELTKAKRKK